MKQIVKRLTLTGHWTEFKFDYKARLFFVKNYTNGDILVSFEQGTNDNESYKIKKGLGEEVAITYSAIDRDCFKTDTIYIKGTGEVEVELLDWDLTIRVLSH